MDFCHATAVLTSEQLSEELSFCCAEHDVKGLEGQQLESKNSLDLFGTTGGLKPGWLLPAGLCHIQAVSCTALEMRFGVVF